MTPTKALQLADDGYATVLKFFDFIAINLTLMFLLNLLGFKETAMDLTAGFLFSVIFLLAGEYLHLYSWSVFRRVRLSFFRLLLTMAVAILVMELAKFAFQNLEGYQITHLNTAIFKQWYAIAFFVLFGIRTFAISVVRGLRNVLNRKLRIAVIGLTPGGLAIERALVHTHHKNDLEIAFYDDRDENRFAYPKRSAVVGKVVTVLEKARAGEIDEVYIALPMVAKDRIRYLLDELSDSTVNTFLVPDLYTYNLSVSQIKTVDGVQTFSVFSSPFGGVGALVK